MAGLSSREFHQGRAMLDAGRFFYVYFCCQQAVEKSLKAIIAEKTKKLPPKLHNLIALAEKADVPVEDKGEDLMRFLTDLYVASRYADVDAPGVHDSDAGHAADCLARATEMVHWLTTFRKK